MARLCRAPWCGQTGHSARAPVVRGAQGACGQLASRDAPQGCKALVPACAGLVPFVAAALRKLAEFCVRTLLRAAQHASARELRCCSSADMSACPWQPGGKHLLRAARCTSAAEV
jgi:hypothetical protein